MSKQSGILYNLLLWAQISFRLLFGQQNSAQTKNKVNWLRPDLDPGSLQFGLLLPFIVIKSSLL